MTSHRIRFEGPAALALRVATTLADADGVELTSSQPPAAIAAGMVALDVEAEGSHEAVTSAVDVVRRELPEGASIDVVAD